MAGTNDPLVDELDLNEDHIAFENGYYWQDGAFFSPGKKPINEGILILGAGAGKLAFAIAGQGFSRSGELMGDMDSSGQLVPKPVTQSVPEPEPEPEVAPPEPPEAEPETPAEDVDDLVG